MEIFKKERVFNTQKDLKAVVQDFSDYLTNNNWKVQSNVQDNKAILQAQKAGILRDIIAADRALTFTFEKQDDGIHVHVGVGKLLQNLGVTAIEALFLSEIFIVVDVPEIAWTDHVEKQLMQQLQQIAQ
ncbi:MULTISPECIES: hypothetical protein [Acidiplasma]|jgi:hypothetical protein|uniref:Uncharacterized protein n=1 Tax=Acidiplasma aeolicum TaxID=507754 RepID=A0A0P9ETV7_9ARCH|nr:MULTISPECIES: hypothetical protein [Acidiplasma]KJE48678.1 hypothetical protein TZ01_08575 [Acidiplasma sp. MBA-1]KPV47575.1 hypothetical protein SE19_00455 [Acidiplasma aeolicum]KQB36468.1 hypothetical protein AOG54_07330 [Acidiplasma aeolicum]WMT55446.1 MAG: hypothetical protein RE470_02095 [Acidiplasma sp.]